MKKSSWKETAGVLPTIDMIGTGRNIEKLRRAAGLTVKDLQDIFGFSTPQAIYKWQRGEALPTLDNMTVLARVLGLPMEEIIVYKHSAPAGEQEGK